MAQRPPGTPKPFDPTTLDRTVIAIPLLEKIEAEEREAAAARRKKIDRPPVIIPIIIDLNLLYPGGRSEAKETVLGWIKQAIQRAATVPERQGVHRAKTDLSSQYVFAELEAPVIQELARLNDAAGEGRRAIYRIWPDFEVGPLLTRSVITVKADAARVSFSAQGEGVVWAVLDSGIQGDHPHFTKHQNLVLPPPLVHRDFSGHARQCSRAQR